MFSDSISKKFIKDHIPDCYKILIEKEVTSTNLLMKNMARGGAEEYSVLIASCQSEGRGRLGRTFHSPGGTGVYMSVLLCPDKEQNPLLITVDAAVCVSRVLERITGEDALIKWVNDIYIKGKKVCGILAEAVDNKVVLGIGINVISPKKGFPDDIKDRAGVLFENKIKKIRERIISELLCELYDIYTRPDRETLYAEYDSRSMIKGKDILVLRNGGEEPAVAVGIDTDYSLIVKKENGKTEKINTGDVSIKI